MGFFFNYRMYSWFKMRRGIIRGGYFNFFVFKVFRGFLGNFKFLGRGGNFVYFVEDIF